MSQKWLGTDREEAKQAKLAFPPAEKTALKTPAEAKSQASGEEHEIELEDAKTPNNKALQSQATVDKACNKIIPAQSGVDFLQTLVEQ